MKHRRVDWTGSCRQALFFTAVSVFTLLITLAHGGTDWTAYNDCVGSTGGNTTTYSAYRDYTGDTSGLLKDDASGSTDGMPTVTFTIPTNPAIQPLLATDYGVNPALGTEAYEIFNGHVDFSGTIIQHCSSCETDCWFVEIKFTNLDPSKKYTFAGSAFRNTTYTDRITQYTILGTDAFVNNSSDEIYLKDGDIVQLLAADNSDTGYVLRWDDIESGSDGEFSIYAESASLNGRHGYPLQGFMLQQVDDDTNDPPVVDAGEDKRIYLVNGSAQIVIDATVTDDDPCALEALTMEWSQLSGPDTVVFSPNVNTEDATVSFPTSGEYVLQLQAWDELSQQQSDTVTINVYKPVGDICPLGDLNNDCYVDIDDLEIFAQQWLNGTCTGPNCADLVGIDGVDFQDYAAMSHNWMQPAESTIIISEFMAVNSYIPYLNPLDIYTRYDWKPSENIYPDWIELYNNSSEPIDLAGWYLTDNPSTKTKWQFPSDMGSELILEPGDFLIVFASNMEPDLFPENDPYVDYCGALHTNFQLSTSGEYLALVQPDGTTVAHEYNDYPEQYPFVSYGIAPDGAAGYLITPTPGIMVNDKWTGAVNSIAYTGKVADTKFSHDRGLYEIAFDVTISCGTAGAEIHYTLDGTEPELTVGGNTLLYSGPIHISETTCLRTKAFKTDLLPSNIDTQTYLFLGDVVEQVKPNDWRYVTSWNGKTADYAMEDNTADIKLVAGNSGYTVDQAKAVIKNAMKKLATLSIVTDPDNLFGAENGLYLNTYESGIYWERPVSAEYFGSDPNDIFQIDCGLRLQGGGSRNPASSPKHSLSLRFRGGYGDAALKTNLFKQTSIDTYNALQLRSVYNNSWLHWDPTQRLRGTLIPDQFIRDSLIAMGQESAGAGTYVHLYLNGLYWGIYNMHERPEASHYASYYGGDSEYYDAVNGGEMVDGDSDQWDILQSTIATANSSSQADWEAINAVLDVENYIDWTIIQHYGLNQDLKTDGNWRAAGGGVFGVPWQFYAWDSERTLENTSVSRPLANDDAVPFLLGPLRNFEEFRIQFADKLYQYFRNQGPLTATSALARFNRLANELDEAVIAETARWGDYRRDVDVRGTAYLYTRNNYWVPELARINTYLEAKETNAINHFKYYYSPALYPSIEPPVFTVDSIAMSGGYISIPCNFDMTNNNGAGVVYYTLDGTDPREYWTGNVSETATLYNGTPIELNQSVTVKARIKSGTTWSALHEATYVDERLPRSLRITEIMYHPADPNCEFIELKNIGNTAVNLNLVQFTKGIDHTFDDVTVEAGNYLLLVKNKSAFDADYTKVPTEVPVIQWDMGSLDNDGDKIKFKDALGQTIQLFSYKDGWYPLTDGGGFSLTIVDPLADPNLWDEKAGWRSSTVSGGSPGEDEVGLAPGSIIINEIMAHSNDTLPDWIELHNTTEQAISIGGWFLSDNDSDYTKYTIDTNIEILGGGYVVFYEDQHFGSSFALSENGETLYLTSGAGGQITGYQISQDFDASEQNVSLGRYLTSTGDLDFVAMSSMTKGTENGDPKVGPIVISEIQYNPASGNTGNEYIELHNISGQTVYLEDLVRRETSPDVFVDETVSWSFTNGINYTFPAGTSLASGEFLIVAKDAAAFNEYYTTLPSGTQVLGPFDNDTSLSNGGEKIRLCKPGEQLYGQSRAWIRVDQVNYDDNSPWPTTPDGNGDSLQRITHSNYGNDVVNWQADSPNPGQ